MDESETSLATYLKVYLALLALLAATVGATYVHLGPLNILITLAIAITKAILVMVFFMHLRQGPRFLWLYAALGFIWFTYLLGGVFVDFVTRNGF